MAVYVSNQTSGLGADVIIDGGVTLVPVEHVTGGSGTWYTIFLNNGDSAVQYFHLHDATTLDAGNDEPNWIIKVPANDTVCWTVPDGVTFSNGLSYCTSEAAGKAVSGTISSTALKVWIVVKRD